jgi:signal transduction histidine kinase
VSAVGSGASPRRAAGEVAVSSLALTLPIALAAAGIDARAFWPLLGTGAVEAGLFAGLLGGIRLRRPAGPAAVWLGRELGAGALLALATALCVAVPYLYPAAGAGPGRAFAAPVGAGAAAAPAAVVGHLLGRGASLLWARWDRLRRRRLLWALTHAQLVAGLLLALGVAAALVAGDLRVGPIAPPLLAAGDGGDPAAVTVAWLVLRVLPTAGALLGLSLVVALAVLPLAALVSYPVLRRATGRLEGLAAAAGSLRSGDLAARVPLAGEDEIASLQADFNRMAAELERALRELQGERDRVTGLLEARRQLVAGVSHELRTPLATARGYLDAALGRDEAAPLRADLETAQAELARLERLIDDLFALARAEVGRLALRAEAVDAGALVRRLVERTAPLAWRQRRVELLAEVAADAPMACADPVRLEQIVDNLLANAVRHTPPGGLVVTAVAAEPEALRIDVRDTGEGIPAEELTRVFERFYRGSGEPHGGAGLGLALVRELTEAMGGSVAAASSPGEGSCFTVRLPRLRRDRDRTATKA